MIIELNDGIERAFRLSDANTQQEAVEQALENLGKTLQRKQRSPCANQERGRVIWTKCGQNSSLLWRSRQRDRLFFD